MVYKRVTGGCFTRDDVWLIVACWIWHFDYSVGYMFHQISLVLQSGQPPHRRGAQDFFVHRGSLPMFVIVNPIVHVTKPVFHLPSGTSTCLLLAFGFE